MRRKSDRGTGTKEIDDLKTGRNDPCPCGSGKKYKKCCLAKDRAAERSAPPPTIARKQESKEGSRVDITGMSPRQLIDHGYRALEKKEGIEACRLWWLAWQKLRPFILENRVTSVDELNGPLDRPVSDWCRDLERETAKAMPKAWVFAFRRIACAGEFLRLLPDHDVGILEDMRLAVAGSHDFLNGLDKAPDRDVAGKVVQSPDPAERPAKTSTEVVSPSSSAEAWSAAYWKAPPSAQYDLFMAIARQPLAEDFAAELDPGELAVEMLSKLEDNNLQEQALELAGALQANWSDYYAKEFYYFDSFLIQRLLYLGDSGALPAVLRRFADNPEDSIDYLLPVFGSLIAYQYRDMAVEMAEKVFPVLRSSTKVIGGAEYDFAAAVFADRLEKTGESDWAALNKAVEPFEYEIRPDLAKDVDTLWSDGFTVEDLRFELERDFGRGVTLLGFGFCRAMREQKNMGFPCGLFMWSQFERLMHENLEQSDVKSFDFAFKVLEDMVAGQLGLRFLGLSSNKTHAVVLVWGLPYVYDYLHARRLIDDGLRGRVLDKVTQVKELLFEIIGNDLWKYDFVRRWQPADSADEGWRAYEAQVFAYSFRRRVPLSGS